MSDAPATESSHHEGNRRRRSRRRRQRRNDNGDASPGVLSDEEIATLLTVPEDKSVIIGLTGEPGAGKSSLAQRFANLGATILDADQAGHEVLKGPATKTKLVEAFGDDILGESGDIDRAALAAKAFASPEQTAALNKIVHPRLTTRMKTALKKAGNFVVIDAALLHELGLNEVCNQTVYVQAPREQRLERISERGWTAEELDRREQALGDAEARRRACDLTVQNSSETSLLDTYAKTILARQLGVDLAAAAAAKQPAASAPGDSEGDDSAEQTPAQPAPPPREAVHAVLNDYLDRSLPDLQEQAEELGVRDVRWLKKPELTNEILRRVAGNRQDDITVEGWIEPQKDNGYLRSMLNDYHAVATDAFIPSQLMRRFGLKAGMHVVGTARAPRGNERCPQLLQVTEVMGHPLDQRPRLIPFTNLTPLHATDRLFMERSDQPHDYSLRVIDLVAPIGKGQRGLIVAQPKCGKTVYLQKIANAITHNNPEVELIVLLVDERPEEVTDMKRSVQGEVIASTFDQTAARHVQCAELTINKARRMVEQGKDVVILLDSITRLARAYNTEAPSSGRIMSGGIESGALVRPKQFFGAARNIENGGSLTILATALVDTGSVMDTVIFEEFKGTGNMELVLDRRLANKRIFPAVDVTQSGTRKDDLMIKDPAEMQRLWALRRFLSDRSPQDAVEFLIGRLKSYKSNVEFLMSIDPDKMSLW